MDTPLQKEPFVTSPTHHLQACIWMWCGLADAAKSYSACACLGATPSAQTSQARSCGVQH